MKKKLLFDTHAFIAFFNRENGSEIIKGLMDEIQNDEAEGFVATITLTELIYLYKRNLDESVARLRVSQIQHSKLSLIPLDDMIAIKAGLLKHHGLSVADTLIAASALSVGASVVSNDPHFSELGIPMIRYR